MPNEAKGKVQTTTKYDVMYRLEQVSKSVPSAKTGLIGYSTM